MTYIPPAGNAIHFVTAPDYTPPAGNAVHFVTGSDPVITTPVRAAVEQVYVLTAQAVAVLSQIYGIKLTTFVSQFYGDTPKILQHLIQHYGDAAAVKRALVQMYGDAVVLRSILDQPYVLPAQLAAFIEQRYGISGAELITVVEQLWALKGVDEVKRVLDQPFGILADPGQLLSYSIVATVQGLSFTPAAVSLERSQSQYCVTCELQVVNQSEYIACQIGGDLLLDINGIIINLFIESKSRNRGHGSVDYVISCLSKSALLDAPYAEPVLEELTGMASNIVSGLAPGFVVNWRTIDWFIPPNTLLPSDKTPLETIKDIAHAGGAIIQTELDGTITVEPLYVVGVPDWEGAVVDYSLSDSLDFLNTSETFDHRLGYNRFLVSDQLTSQTTTRLEEENISDTSKYIRGYKTPWTDNFSMRHSGGNWVTVEQLPIEVAEKTEVVEFVAGEGGVSYPIYDIITMVWLQEPLGAVTHSEDGRLVANVKGESLLSITYQTKCRVWKVVNPRNEQVQFIVDEVIT